MSDGDCRDGIFFDYGDDGYRDGSFFDYGDDGDDGRSERIYMIMSMMIEVKGRVVYIHTVRLWLVFNVKIVMWLQMSFIGKM